MAVQQSAPVPVSAPASAPIEQVSMTEHSNFRAAAVVWFVVGVIEILIAARFTGIFGNTASRTNTFETASLVALVVYAVIGWGIVVLIRIVTAPKGTKPASS